jgi:hypothetical protein
MALNRVRTQDRDGGNTNQLFNGDGDGDVGEIPSNDGPTHSEVIGIFDDKTKGRLSQLKKESPEEHAVVVLQKRFRKKFNSRHRLHRVNLMERLELESKLTRTCSLLVVLTTMLFTLLQEIAIEARYVDWLGLQNVYEVAYSLKEESDGAPIAAAEVKTTGELRSYLHYASQQSRAMQTGSSEYLKRDAEQTLWKEFTQFDEPIRRDSSAMKPRVDSDGFTFTSWVKSDESMTESYIVRKPLTAAGTSKFLSCWGWFVGDKRRGLHFGAHDYGRACPADMKDCQEEVIVTSDSFETGFHLESVVITERAVRMYQNGALMGEAPMPRIMTDCSGQMLEFGSVRMEIQDLTFFPRELTTSEMAEIYSLGMTLGAISNGRIPNYFLPTMVDEINSETGQKLAEMGKQRTAETEKIVVGQVLTRGVSKAYVKAVYPVTMVQPTPGCVATADTRCYIIKGVNETHEVDQYLGTAFYDLLPGPAFGMVPGSRIRVDYGAARRHIYELSTFPPSKGGSHTYSYWAKYVETGVGGAYLFSHHEHANTADALIRIIFRGKSSDIRPYSGPHYGYDPATDKFLIPGNGHPKAYGPLLDIERGEDAILRHFAHVFDAEAKRVCAYQDGELMKCVDWASAADVDQNVTDLHYIGLGHRGPGALDLIADLQQFHLYTGAALNASEVRTIAFKSTDPHTGSPLRECSVPADMLADSAAFRDLSEHDCAWFEQQRKVFPSVCNDVDVRENCKVACDISPLCFGVNTDFKKTSVWKRVMWFPVEKPQVCTTKEMTAELAREKCRANTANPVDRGWTDGMEIIELYDHHLTSEPDRQFINVTNCDDLYARIDPTCSFDLGIEEETGEDWNTWFGNTLLTTQQYTLSFWMKPVRTDQAFNPWAIFYASLNPPQILAAFEGTELQLFSPCKIDSNGDTVQRDHQDDVFTLHDFPIDEWTFITIVFAGKRDESMGDKNFAYVINSNYNWEANALGRWCFPSWSDGSGRFLEAVSAHGVLMSPVLVRAGVVPMSQLQQEYYEGKVEYELRRGPRVPDRERYELIDLEPEPYASAGYLIAPPIVLQQRKMPSSQCATKLGTAALGIAKEDVVKGPACTAPYTCDDDLGMFTCNADSSPETHFGKAQTTVNGDEFFWEFLTSITDVPILVRDRKQYSTTQFIDMQTTDLRVIFLVVAPKVGIITLVEITAGFVANVEVEYNIYHLQAVEGTPEITYFVLFVIHILCVAKIMFYVRDCLMHKRPYEGAFYAILAGVSALYQVIATYQMWRSKDKFYVLMNNIREVPWVDPQSGTTIDDTVVFFFTELDMIYQFVFTAEYMRMASFFNALLVLIALFVSTKTHPRIALLVSTVAECYDDLFHFLLLWAIIYFSFGIMATIIFGAKYEAFKDTTTTVGITQLDMMIGGLEYVPEDFAADTLLMIYISCFFMVLFFFMLNFMLSIVVEAYLRVKRAIEDQETEQNFIMDMASVLHLMVRSKVDKWPDAEQVNDTLAECSSLMTINVDTLAKVDPEWPRSSRVRYVKYYERYDFLKPKKVQSNIQTFDTAIDTLEHRFAVVIGQPIPTVHERMATSKKKKPEKFDVKFTRIERKLDWLLENTGGPGGQEALALLSQPTVAPTLSGSGPAGLDGSMRQSTRPSDGPSNMLPTNSDARTALVERRHIVV